MTLFFVGVVEMAIAASWTRLVSKNSVVMNGLVTYVNIFIWYYVIEQVVHNLAGWSAIVPYAGGCALGSMFGGTDPKVILRRAKRILRKAGFLKRRGAKRTGATKLRVPAEL